MRSTRLVLACLLVAACRGAAPAATPSPARVSQTGTASWYGPGFNGKPTTSGETYDQNALTAAHRTLPLGTRVRVTSTTNGKSVEVRINDRGPFVGKRILDVSFAAAKVLEMIGPGTAEVVIEVLSSPVQLSEVPALVRYTVQLGSYSSREAAEAARARLASAARDARVVATKGAQTLYRVRAGDFADIDEARSEAARLKRQGIDAIVVER